MTELEKVLDKFGKQVTTTAKKNLTSKGISNTGKLKNSLKYQVDGDKVEFFMEDYGVGIDAGRHGTERKASSNSLFTPSKAGFPNVTAIKKWVRTKPVKFTDTGKKISVDSMAFVIGRSIKRRGIKATMFFSDAFIPKMSNLPDQAIEAVAKDMVNQMKQQIKDLN